jgi:hypothetical protein
VQDAQDQLRDFLQHCVSSPLGRLSLADRGGGAA